MRMKKIFILSILLTFSFIRLSACSCLLTGNSFCQTIANDTTVVSVIMAEKVGSYYYGMRIKCLTVLKGQFPGDTILVWGDNGILCRKSTSTYSTGDTLIVALQKCDKTGNTLFTPQYPAGLELASDYQLSACGIYSLRVGEGSVYGAITAAIFQTMPLDQLLNQNCVLLGQTTNAISSTVLIGPNPVVGQLSIQFPSIQQACLQVYNASGQLLARHSFMDTVFIADFSGYAEGIYFIELKTDGFREVKMIVLAR